MANLKAPFPWAGGKSRAAHLIWPRFGDVPNYVEPFAGSLAVLLARPTAPRVETANDLDCYLANFWRAVQADPEEVAWYADWPVSECDLHARHRWLVTTGRERVAALKTDPTHYDPMVAGWWVWGLCQWIGTGWCGGALSQKLPHIGGAGRGEHRAPVAEQLPYLAGTGQGVTLPRPAGAGIHASAFNRKTGGLVDYMAALAERLRRVRVTCGNWDRILGPSVTEKIGVTGILLDPPYAGYEDMYSEANAVAAEVRAWALANGDNPKLRIALCGYEGEHAMPAEWECVAWKAGGGYAGQRKDRSNNNGARERIWFSPACLKPAHTPSLFDYLEVAA